MPIVLLRGWSVLNVVLLVLEIKKAFLLVLRRVVGITVMKLNEDKPYHCLCDPCFKEEAEERRYNKAIQKQRIIPYLRSPSATFLLLYFFCIHPSLSKTSKTTFTTPSR